MITILLVAVFGLVGWVIGEVYLPDVVVLCTIIGCIFGLILRVSAGSSNGDGFFDGLGDFGSCDGGGGGGD